jgi:hypothetical protein
MQGPAGNREQPMIYQSDAIASSRKPRQFKKLDKTFIYQPNHPYKRIFNIF